MTAARSTSQASSGQLVDDPRVVLARTSGRGAAGARNLGLTLATGELVTFLDSRQLVVPDDSSWCSSTSHPTPSGRSTSSSCAPRRLPRPRARRARTSRRPGAQATSSTSGCSSCAAALAAVTRQGTDGPFDPGSSASPTGTSSSAWSPTSAARAPGRARSTTRRRGTGSRQAPYGPASPRHPRPARRRVGGRAPGPVAEWHFPQLTETYIQADIAGLLALGAEVEVWSSEDVAVPYEPGVAWRRGRLEDHIADFRPDVVLTHWLQHRLRPAPHDPRLGHPPRRPRPRLRLRRETAAGSSADPGIALHLFAHIGGRRTPAYPNVSIDPVGFDPGRVWPAPDPDRRMVLRVTAGLPTKDLETFLLTAKRCPDHRFVLGDRPQLPRGGADRGGGRAARRDLDSPAEVLVDLRSRQGRRAHHGGRHLPAHPRRPPPAGHADLPAGGDGRGGLRPRPRSARQRSTSARAAVRYAGPTPEARAEPAAALVNDTLHLERRARGRTSGGSPSTTRGPAPPRRSRGRRPGRAPGGGGSPSDPHGRCSPR